VGTILRPGTAHTGLSNPAAVLGSWWFFYHEIVLIGKGPPNIATGSEVTDYAAQIMVSARTHSFNH
jgi:hypothetical protein